MKTSRYTVGDVATKLQECWQDDRGVALTEYVILNMAMLPAVFWLFHPDNGLYQAMRDQYDLTTLLLVFPGP